MIEKVVKTDSPEISVTKNSFHGYFQIWCFCRCIIRILLSKRKLTPDEFAEIMKHPHITKHCLEGIVGFEDIALWASNHHEKLDGSGYPQGLSASDLDFYSRLIACLDIYQALREERPYRNAMGHINAMEILNNMVILGLVDSVIVNDISRVFINT